MPSNLDPDVEGFRSSLLTVDRPALPRLRCKCSAHPPLLSPLLRPFCPQTPASRAFQVEEQLIPQLDDHLSGNDSHAQAQAGPKFFSAIGAIAAPVQLLSDVIAHQ